MDNDRWILVKLSQIEKRVDSIEKNSLTHLYNQIWDIRNEMVTKWEVRLIVSLMVGILSLILIEY